MIFRALLFLITFLVMPVESAAAQHPVPLQVTTRAEALFQDLVKRQLFQGAVVIARGEKVSYSAGFGFADRERAVPFTPDTPTDTASIAKTFTAAGLLLLAAEGRVDLESPVQNLLPAFPHAATRVRHLLAHSAGLPDYEWFDKRVAPSEPRTNAVHLAVIAKELPSPAFPPGTAFAYDNLAYDVAAMVIERVTGTTFAEFIDTRFSRPLDLQAFVRPARFSDWSGVRTRGYRRTAGGWADHDAHDLEGFYGADNIYLSAKALQRWAAGHGRLMGARLREAVTRARLDDGRATGLTLGSWYASADGSRRYYTGHHNGFYSVAYVDDARDLSFAWVANDAPPAWIQTGLTRALVAMAEGRAPEALVAPPAADVEDPTGRYQVPSIGEVVVLRGEGKTLRVRQGGVVYDAFRVARGMHYVPGLDANLRFGVDAAGRITLFWHSVFVVAQAIAREPAPGR